MNRSSFSKLTPVLLFGGILLVLIGIFVYPTFGFSEACVGKCASPRALPWNYNILNTAGLNPPTYYYYAPYILLDVLVWTIISLIVTGFIWLISLKFRKNNTETSYSARGAVIIITIGVILLAALLFPKGYTVSPGRGVSDEQFQITKERCTGVSISDPSPYGLYDGGGRALCFGWLH